jgi:hypothetical protein
VSSFRDRQAAGWAVYYPSILGWVCVKVAGKKTFNETFNDFFNNRVSTEQCDAGFRHCFSETSGSNRRAPWATAVGCKFPA